MEPQIFTCFYCGKRFEVEYNRATGMPSQKNYWRYWTDEKWNYKEVRRKLENQRGKKICNKCLRHIWTKKVWELIDQIKKQSKRATLASYVYHKLV